MQSLSFYFRNPNAILLSLLMRLNWAFPDKLYLKLLYRLKMGKRLNLKRPKTFNEKLQWLKLYNRKPEYTTMVDKYAVKEYVANIVGEEYIIPTLGVWDTPNDIDWDSLPDKFVLKTTHGGGGNGVVICKDKSNFDKQKAVNILWNSYKLDIYRVLREWPYKNVPKRIIAEKYMNDKTSNDLVDYKFTCFNGYADNVMVCTERSTGKPKFYFFDREWNLMPLNIRGKNTNKNFKLPKPSCMDKMFELAGKLSEGIPFLRVDFYCVENHPYFGELTFFPDSGFDKNLLKETEEYFGNKIILPAINNNN